MKKIIIWFVSAVVLIAGGYFTMEYLNQKEKEQVQEEKFWKAQKIRVEKYIHYNIQDVKSITFTKKEVSPMGVPKLKGYINKDEQLWFIASISTTKDFEDDFSRSGELGKLIKDPEKSVSEIEKEEKAKKQ
ncbi:DUF1433 domain-containing protein [Bacillus pseudomycoides]|uniref:DUF1433 domain-containing protein n=3 Tax=Bacillus pseudomycoides TaxID=64104 RepID=UPI0001A19703|nr:DUF1433 domain-containing protein [Bacillus pseudomycoides]EEM13811.1 hypothetical protein bpmyx0001_53370 [Bacillus pseudomycoides DSM 12442]MED1599159.1 DUF1433 domain-containing protein [Bacillus pseudomycoides]PDY09024.1 DUF1433 domain-containing protein [Bacillus pseudomycoides]PEU33706.1 DUF1433 domain-containing protein [Bacillus pseudomycoides]PGA73560.1 DUF1433 domain-containing protein [Bacillus pseudomycoides]